MTANESVGLFFIVIIPVVGGVVALIKTFTSPINKLEIAIERLIVMLEQMKNDNRNRDKRLDKHDGEIEVLQKEVQGLDHRICIIERECDKNDFR